MSDEKQLANVLPEDITGLLLWEKQCLENINGLTSDLKFIRRKIANIRLNCPHSEVFYEDFVPSEPNVLNPFYKNYEQKRCKACLRPMGISKKSVRQSEQFIL